MAHRLRRSFVAAACLVALVACGSDGSDAGDDGEAAPPAEGEGSAPTAPVEADEPPFEVAEVTETFVDPSRPTPAGSETPARPERSVVTRIVHPTGGGPHPLIVLSHGASGHPDEYAEQIPQWAADGFVVAAPAFPLTNGDVPGALTHVFDVVDQPGDVSLVIDEVLAASADADSPLHGLVDPDAIGVVGHSLGGATTWLVAFDSKRRDERIDSAVIFAGLTVPMDDSELELGSGLPLLVLHGDADDVPIAADRDPWDAAASPKWFVTLLGAEHRIAFTDEPSPHDELVTRTILDFWHGTLDGDEEALARVTTSATDPELSRVDHQ